MYQTANSEQRQAGLTSPFISAAHHRPLAPNKSSVAADFYLPVSHGHATASHHRTTPKTTCAAAPNFCSVEENCCSTPKNFCAVAPSIYSVTDYICAMSPNTFSMAPHFYSMTENFCATPKNCCAVAPHQGVAAHLRPAPRPVYTSFHSTFHSPKTTEKWHE